MFWENQCTFSRKRLLLAVVKKLNENYIIFWRNCLFNDDNSINGNKLRTYRKFKVKYELEKYLLLNLDKNVTKN